MHLSEATAIGLILLGVSGISYILLKYLLRAVPGPNADSPINLGESDGQPMTVDPRVVERTSEQEFEHRRAETLLRIISELTSTLDLEQLLHRTLQVVNQVIGASHATCMVLKDGEKKLRHLATIGYPNPTPAGGLPSALNIDQGLVGWIIRNKEPALIADVLNDERWLVIPGSEFKHRSAMGVPMMRGENILGVLMLFHPQVGYFSQDHLDLVRAAASQMAVAINNASLYELTRDQANELRFLLRSQQIETSRTIAILESIAEGVIVTDQENRITLFNESAHQIFQLHPVQVLNQDLQSLSELFGNSIRTWIEKILAWSNNPADCEGGVTYSEQITLRDGRILAVNLAPVLSEGKFFGTVSIFHDITHQIEVDRLKSEFVATVSHELRTPMTAIKGYVDILLMGAAGELNSQQRRFLDIVKGNTERLTILVNDLLDLSRIEAGKVILTMQPLDLRTILEESLNEFRRRALNEGKSIEFILHCPEELPRVRGDAERVRQILANLLSNAYHYTPSTPSDNSKSKNHVILSASLAGEEIQVDIADTGVGIPPTEQDRVFERFYRGENPLVLSTAGTGLGLSIVQQLIHMHQGRIWLRSSGIPGEGSVFSFTLPVYSLNNQPGSGVANG